MQISKNRKLCITNELIPTSLSILFYVCCPLIYKMKQSWNPITTIITLISNTYSYIQLSYIWYNELHSKCGMECIFSFMKLLRKIKANNIKTCTHNNNNAIHIFKAYSTYYVVYLEIWISTLMINAGYLNITEENVFS